MKNILGFFVCCKCEERSLKGEMQIPQNLEKYEISQDNTIAPSAQRLERLSQQSQRKSRVSNTKIQTNTETQVTTSTRQETPHTTSFAQINTSQNKNQAVGNVEEEHNQAIDKFANIRDMSLKSGIQTQVAYLISRNIQSLEQPQLTLEIVESKEVEDKEPIIIYPSGCTTSKRSTQDGVTIFGTLSEEIETSPGLIDIKTCDVVIPTNEHGFGLKHFAIYFDQESNEYKLVDLYQGSGTFILLSNPLQVKENHIISFGNSHATFTLNQNDDIQIKFIAGQLKGQVYEFKKTDEKIKIGRHANTDIKITENGLSRIQCQLTYTPQGWMLKDGEDNRMSTNGTWLFTSEPQVVTNQMIFKAGKTIFRAHLA